MLGRVLSGEAGLTMQQANGTGMTQKHRELQDVAIRWLYGIGCSVFAKEVPTQNGVADALGVRTRNTGGTVYYIEAKSSRTDLICPKQRLVYRTSVGDVVRYCHSHAYRKDKSRGKKGWDRCARCQQLHSQRFDTGIDFYYLIVADGVSVEPALYPEWGVLNEKGRVIRKAKRMPRERDTKSAIQAIAHVLVYKVFGKMYQL